MVRLHAVVDSLPLLLQVEEGLADVVEARQVIETADLVPRLARQPRCRVAVRVFEPDAAGQQEAPLVVVDLLVVFKNVDAQQEGEEQLKRVKRGEVLQSTI